MNVNVQLCGLVIAIFLFVLSATRKKIGFDSEKTFKNMLLLTIACLSLDILSVVAITYWNESYPVFVHIVCKGYLISMLWVGWIYFCYTMLGLNSDLKAHIKTRHIMALVTLCESIAIAILKINVHFEAEELYTYGPAVYASYFFNIFIIVSSFVVAVYILKTKNSRRGMAMIMTTILWIIAAIIQSINNNLLLVGFAMAVGVMIVFIVLDNPDTYFDKELGCFNAYALSAYVNSKFFRKERFSLFDISVSDVKALEDKNVDVKSATKKLVSLIEKNKKIKLFKNLNTGLVGIADKEEDLEPVIEIVSEFLKKYPNTSQNILFFTVEDAYELDDSNNLNKFLTYVRNKNEKTTSLVSHTSQNTINRYREIQTIEQEIKKAIDEDRIEVFFQPIVELNKSKINSCEALVRLRNIDGTYLPPAKFIPVAEDTGIIKKIGEIVLDKVCKFLKNTCAVESGIEKVHVNLSAVQCDDIQTASQLLKIVEENNISSKFINFEITETAVSSNKEALLENMNTLISKGFSFSLDDFGKGESNLMYIVDLPVDELKIDMDLSKAFFINPKAKIVVRAISNMANMLNLPLVVEGIENDFEVNAIKNEKITHIQGYVISKPLPIPDFIDFINSGFKFNLLGNKTETEENNILDFYKIKINNKNVLLVEDNDLNAEIETEILKLEGFQVDRVSDGVYALDVLSKAENHKYDLIIMDIQMPIMDGFETTRRIRALSNKTNSNTPVIALSSMNIKELKRQALKCGMSNQLTKPFSIQDLRNIIDY